MAGKVVVENLVKRYGSAEAVRGVSFEVNEGEIFGLLGPNGAGKTSTVECVIGLRVPDGGSIRVCGEDAVAHPDRVKRRIGAALQATALQDKITPREALRLFGSFYPKPASPQSLIERFALTEKADSTYQTLSGGQRQRLALALAFVNNPEVLFLDEPTTGLDPQSRRDLHGAIRRMRQDGHTVLLTTHYIEEAHQLCDRIAVIDHGKVIALGSPDELIARSNTRPCVRLRSARPLDRQSLLSLPGVVGAATGGGEGAGVTGDDAGSTGGASVEIRTSDVSRTVIELARMLDAGGVELLDLSIRRPSLEDVFIELTGTSLRE